MCHRMGRIQPIGSLWNLAGRRRDTLYLCLICYNYIGKNDAIICRNLAFSLKLDTCQNSNTLSGNYS